MRTPNIPKTIQIWIDKNYDLINDFHMEEDGFSGDDRNPYSIWLYLADGYVNYMTETSCIHAFRVSDFMDEVKCIEPGRAA